jgi:hypothetical protein
MDVWGKPSAGAGAGVQWGTVRLENSGGAWEGSLSGVYSSDRGDIIAIWYKGTGGYAGLSYFELLTGTGPWTIQGQIQPGDPPNPESFPPLAGTTFAATASANPALPTPVAYGPVTVVEGTASNGEGGNDLEVVSTGAGGVQHARASDSHWVLALNDPRVSGGNVADLHLDAWGYCASSCAAIQWGRMRTTNAQGAWDGAFTGTWDGGHGDTYVSWLTGKGAYAGLTFFYLGTDYPPNKLQGLIYPGAPPHP